MRIGRFAGRDGGEPFWGVIDGEQVRPLEGGIADWGPGLTADFSSALPYAPVDPVDRSSLRMVAPVESTAKVVAVGATYVKHIEDLGLQMPDQPAAFLRTVESMIGPGDEIRYPGLTEQLDYEGELTAVIGAPVSGGGAAASAAILGYTVANDVSARDMQFGGGVTGMDMFSAKALDGTGPVGPWIVTRDEFGDETPDLMLEVTVDGESRQCERTSALAPGIGEIVTYVAERSALRPGDVVLTGTPHGVGHEDGRYLEPGQTVEVTIEGIGTLTNTVGPKIDDGRSTSRKKAS